MKIAAVIVNWNGGAANLACLASLRAQTRPPEQVLFVDNASDDGSLELVRNAHPDLAVIANTENLGYALGNNAGIERALAEGAEAVLVLNNDVVLDPDVVEALEVTLEQQPEVGIVGPRVVFDHDPTRLWAAGGMLTWRENLTTLLGQGKQDGPEWCQERSVDYVPGCALLVRRAVLEELGGFDESYFAYTEDVDFGLSARRAGFGSLVAGSVRARHASSTATGGGYNPRRKYMMGVNSVWFLRRHAGLRQWLSFCVYDVLSLPLVWLAGLPRGRGRAVCAKALGIVHGLFGRRVDPERLRPGSSWLW